MSSVYCGAVTRNAPGRDIFVAALVIFAVLSPPAAAQQTYRFTRWEVTHYCHQMHRKIDRIWTDMHATPRRLRREARVRIDYHRIFVGIRDRAPDYRWWPLRMYTYNLRVQTRRLRDAARHQAARHWGRFSTAMRRLDRLKKRQIHNARRYGFGRCERAYFH